LNPLEKIGSPKSAGFDNPSKREKAKSIFFFSEKEVSTDSPALSNIYPQ
jgi:hypothetical protein